MEPTTEVIEAASRLARLVDGLGPGQLYRVAAGPGVTVHEVLYQVIERAGVDACRFRGDPPPRRRPTLQYGWVPRDELRAALAELEVAICSPGALERRVTAPGGDVTGSTLARFVALDLMTAGFEVARATGRAFDPPPDLVTGLLGFARAALSDDLRPTPAVRAA